MKINSNVFKKGLFFSLCALGASAFTSCSNEDLQTSAPANNDDQVSVELKATIVDSPLTALTRAQDGLNSGTFSSPEQNASVFIDNGSGQFVHYEYTASGSSLTAPASPKATFPAEVTSVNVFAWYPSTSSGATSFSIQTDQNSDANYNKSDLMIAQKAACTRTLENNQWSVTPADLQFKHVMSKIVLTVTPAYGVKIKAARLLSIKPTVSITGYSNGTIPTTLGIGAASGTAGNVVLKSSGTDTGNEAGDASYTYCGVFPPQDIAAGAAFLEIDAEYLGNTSTISFALESATTFASEKAYAVNVLVGTILSDVNATISGWPTNGNDPVEITVGNVTDPAKMRDENAIYNPLAWVAQYNVASNGTMYTYHAVPGNVFTYNDAKALTVSGYHLPTFAEQVAIIPSDNAAGTGTNIFAQENNSAASPYVMTEVASNVHGTAIAAGMKSYFMKADALNYYAVRFVNSTPSNYASAWHYKMVPGSGLTIESYLLDTKPKSDNEAKAILAALPTTKEWSKAANLTPGEGYSTISGTTGSLVRRFLPASGYKNNSGSGVSDQGVGHYVYCWSATAVPGDATMAFLWLINSAGASGFMFDYSYAKTGGFSVRLFHD